jgi:hypothetical protein
VYLLPLQAHALINARCPVWLAWLVSVIFVLLESAVFDLLFFAIVVPFFQDALFDATLRAAGLERMFKTRVPVSGLRLCCRGVSSGIALVWFLVLAQVRWITCQYYVINTASDYHSYYYCPTSFDSCFGYICCLLYQWLDCMVSSIEDEMTYINSPYKLGPSYPLRFRI